MPEGDVAPARQTATRAPRALADDIERWMADEPVSALRESLVQRARRWARKHRTAVAAAAGLLITSTIALAVGTALITREWNEAQAQRNLARAQGQQARQAVHLLTKVADSGFDEQLDPLQKEFLENALAYYEQFTGNAADLPEREARARPRLPADGRYPAQARAAPGIRAGLSQRDRDARAAGRAAERRREKRNRRWPAPGPCWQTCWSAAAPTKARPSPCTDRRSRPSRPSPTPRRRPPA